MGGCAGFCPLLSPVSDKDANSDVLVDLGLACENVMSLVDNDFDSDKT